tara:strand:- start:246 stop:416 length:171 start_codon:yes stop_codon:yes gene_type:complete
LVVKNYVNKIKRYYLAKVTPYQKHRKKIKISLDNKLIFNSGGEGGGDGVTLNFKLK